MDAVKTNIVNLKFTQKAILQVIRGSVYQKIHNV